MSHPYHHALSSVKKWGGDYQDYLPVHRWFDASKGHFADIRHRALRHHAEGIFLCETLFGCTITNHNGRVVPVRWIAEQHVKEDLSLIPTAGDWLKCIILEPWMVRKGTLEPDVKQTATICL